MTRVAHLADLHIGYSHLASRDPSGRNQRQVDFENAALLAADKICNSDVDVCLVAGDLLHDTNLYPAALAGAVRFCKRIVDSGVPLVAIGGNHDEAEGEGRYSALEFLSEHAGLIWLRRQEPWEFNDLCIHPVSYRMLSRALAGRAELAPFQWKEGASNILLAHAYAPGKGVPELPPGVEMEIPEDWLKDDRWAACLLGHIHHHGEIAPRVFYSGSTERRNFGESKETPGFWLHDFKDGKLQQSTSIPIETLGENSPRRMIDVKIDAQGLSLRELDQKVLSLFDEKKVAGAMFRIRLLSASSEIDRRRTEKSWAREFRLREGMYFESVVETAEIAEALQVEFAGPPQDIARGFIDFLQKSGASKETQGAAADALAEAQERLFAQESE